MFFCVLLPFPLSCLDRSPVSVNSFRGVKVQVATQQAKSPYPLLIQVTLTQPEPHANSLVLRRSSRSAAFNLSRALTLLQCVSWPLHLQPLALGEGRREADCRWILLFLSAGRHQTTNRPRGGSVVSYVFIT